MSENCKHQTKTSDGMLCWECGEYLRMRTSEEIEKDAEEYIDRDSYENGERRADHVLPCILEVLLDIRQLMINERRRGSKKK